MKKTNVSKQIKEYGEVLGDLLTVSFAELADEYIKKIMNGYRKAIRSKEIDVLDGLEGIKTRTLETEYLETLLDIANTTYKDLKNEIYQEIKKTPKKNNEVSLAEDYISPSLKKRLKKAAKMAVQEIGTSLEKTVKFQYINTLDYSDSESEVERDMKAAAAEYIEGSSIKAGTMLNASQAVNFARNDFLFSDEMDKDIEAFKFNNGDPVSPICIDLAGKIFSKNDPNFERYLPPLHFNCKSYVTPILNGKLGSRIIEQLKPSKSELDKFVQFSEDEEKNCC